MVIIYKGWKSSRTRKQYVSACVRARVRAAPADVLVCAGVMSVVRRSHLYESNILFIVM